MKTMNLLAAALFAVACLLSTSPLFSQAPIWETYSQNTQTSTPTTVMVDVNQAQFAPMDRIGFLIVSAVAPLNAVATDCAAAEFLDSDAFYDLMDLQEDLLIELSEWTDNVMIGYTVSGCNRQDYIYVADTTEVRKGIQQFYQQNAAGQKTSISIESDPDWNVYLKQIYPSPEAMESIQNQKVIDQLIGEGDDLSKPRKIEHWAFFADKANRKLFKKWAEANSFMVVLEYMAEDQLKVPFAIQMYRTDYATPESINPLTIELKEQAQKLGGIYDGWETTVIK